MIYTTYPLAATFMCAASLGFYQCLDHVREPDALLAFLHACALALAFWLVTQSYPPANPWILLLAHTVTWVNCRYTDLESAPKAVATKMVLVLLPQPETTGDQGKRRRPH